MNDRVDDIFFEARRIADPAERQAFLSKACDDASELLAEVTALLAAEDKAGETFGETLVDAPRTELPTEPEPGAIGPIGPIGHLGQVIGRYKLLQKIGEGGCGVVYMAQQSEPVKRRVALKIIKPGMDTRQVIARFEAERQALALMSHPNIAKVFDAGATATGHPYFVMELVPGQPITTFCDEKKLSNRERLRLLIRVCQAVQHAHQKGIIHRDLKPGNVLVTMNGDRLVPKVIDFGVAKATQQALTDKTLFTVHGHFIGTPAYMSPEQASLTSYDIDTRSDIYSLGVLLYELLTGRTPFDSRKLCEAGYDEIRRILTEEEPQKPSTRICSMQDEELTTLASQRHSGPNRLRRMARGDLDWIVMKALEKDRRRRYETANGLAEDLRRYLADEPVTAGRPGFAYTFGKFLRRNRTAATIVLLLAAVALAGLFEMTSRRQERAQLAQHETEQIFLAAVQGRVALVGEKLRNIERIVSQYRKGASRLMAMPREHLPHRALTAANRDGFYLDEDYYPPGDRRPPGMVYEESYGTEVSWQHATVLLPTHHGGDPPPDALDDGQRLARMNDIFSMVHPEHPDLKWSFASATSGAFVGFPGSGRYRDKPDYTPQSRTWYLDALRANSGRPRWTRPYSDASTREFMVSCVATVHVDDTQAGVVGVDVPMRQIQEWLRGQAQFPDETRCLILMPFGDPAESSSDPDYRIFVDTTYQTRADGWKSVIEPRSIDQLPEFIRSYTQGIIKDTGTPAETAFEHGMLLASARLEGLNWIIIVIASSETGRNTP